MHGLTAGDLHIEEVPMPLEAGAASSIQLLWKGKSNNRNPGEVLTPYFRTLLETAVERKLPIELHFEKIEHFNSSTITSMIELIQDSRARSVKLILVYDQALRWQRLNFDALRVFVSDKDDLLELRAV
jgi:hypothetical protein